MPYRILIIDDELRDWKGYRSIEKRYPGVFEVDISRCFSSKEDDETAASHRLGTRRYDVILLDFSFDVHPEQGVEILLNLRKDLGGPNAQTYVIGTSCSWDDNIQRAMMRVLTKKGFGRALDGWTGKGRDCERGLCEELDKFLSSRGMNPEEIRGK